MKRGYIIKLGGRLSTLERSHIDSSSMVGDEFVEVTTSRDEGWGRVGSEPSSEGNYVSLSSTDTSEEGKQGQGTPEVQGVGLGIGEDGSSDRSSRREVLGTHPPLGSYKTRT